MYFILEKSFVYKHHLKTHREIVLIYSIRLKISVSNLLTLVQSNMYTHVNPKYTNTNTNVKHYKSMRRHVNTDAQQQGT